MTLDDIERALRALGLSGIAATLNTRVMQLYAYVEPRSFGARRSVPGPAHLGDQRRGAAERRASTPQAPVAALCAGTPGGVILAGLLDLGHFKATNFPSDRVADAVAHAAANAGPLQMTLRSPCPGSDDALVAAAP